MKFHGRKAELKLLHEAWASDRSGFIPIYGRRRIGKSELIIRFLDGKRGLYFVGKRAPAEAQISEFLEVAGRSIGMPALGEARVSSWRAAFDLIAGQIDSGSGKFVVVLDEFQWIAEASPEIASVLQERWDRVWSKSGKILLILCGSYLGFMEREILGKGSPLFGRRTAQLLLKPFDHLEAASFHSKYSPTDKARAYAICGGVPAYLLEFDDGVSIEQNIATRLLDDKSALAREPEFLLREELRDLAPYHAVLMALAEGGNTPMQMAKATGMDPRALPYHLQALIGLGYVQKRHPLTGARPSLRTVRYALDDPLLRFWFRFIFPHQSALRLLGPERSFSEIVKPRLDSYFGSCFERLCREALPLLYRKEGVACAFEVGEYWDSQVQIDLVGLRADNWTDIGECKWGPVASQSSLAGELETKVQLYPNTRNATVARRLFLRSSRGKAMAAEVKVHTLEDLYEL